MNALIKFFLHRSFVVNLVSAFIILAGVLFGSMIKRDLIPPFEYTMIRIEASLPGASATEVEKYLTYPVETALQGVPSVDKIRSRSQTGSMRVRLFFPADYSDIDGAVEDITNRVDAIRWQLPEQSREFSVKQVKVTDVFQVALALENFEQTNTEHRNLARKLADRISALPGIIDASVDMIPQNVYINIRPEKLRRYEISIEEIRLKVRQALTFSPIGKFAAEEQIFAIEVKRPAEALEELEKLTLRSNRTGDVIRLADVATVGLAVDEVKQIHRINGHSTINIYVRKDTRSDSIVLKGKVQKVVADFNDTLPAPLKVFSFIDGASFIENQLATLKGNGLFGFVLVLLILTLFFNFRVSLVTSFGIPIAYCGTLITLYALGISIDLISVVGMILVLGILVDDAIIIAERYMENLEEGYSRQDAAFRASRDLMLPVTGTVLTTIFAFSPMILIASEIAVVFYAIPIVIIASLIMSWLESFFILPNHLMHFIKKPAKDHQNTFFATVKQAYKRLLGGILKLRYLVVVGLLAFMAASIWVGKNKIQQNFMFNPDIERISVNVVIKDSSSFKKTSKLISPIEAFILSLPKDKIEHVTSDVGGLWTKGRWFEGPRYAKINAYIHKNETYPKAVKKEYGKIIKDKVAELKTDAFETLKVKTEFRGHDEIKKNMVTLKLSGKDDANYRDIKTRLAELTQSEKLNISMEEEQKDFEKKWLFVPNLESISRHQIGQSEITQQLRSYFVPHELTQLRVDGETRWVYTQVQKAKSLDENVLNRMQIQNQMGLSVPLKSLGRWVQTEQLSRISHEQGRRILAFDFSFDPEKDMNIVKAMEETKALSAKIVEDFPSLDAKVENADEDEANRKTWALKVASVCILLVLFTLALVLSSLTLPFIVGLPIPFGLMGIVWALYLHDLPMGMMSLVGLIGTVGVSVNDSLIMVDQMNKRAAEFGSMQREDIIEGAASRLRAIILTTVTTLGGVFPMAYGIGGESGFTQPLAFSIGWGLFFSTFLTLFALPAFVEIRRDFGGLWRRLRGIEETQRPAKPLSPVRTPEEDLGHVAMTPTHSRPNNRPPEL